MMLQHQLRGQLLRRRWDSTQLAAGGAMRSGLARRVVAEKATGLAGGDVGEVEVKHSAGIAARRSRASAHGLSHEDKELDEQQQRDLGTEVEQQHEHASAAPPRDGTAAASTSGHDHSNRINRSPVPAAGRLESVSFEEGGAFHPHRNAEEAQTQNGQLQASLKNKHMRPAGLSADRDREIHDEIKGCDDWRDVLDVAADEAGVDGLSLRTGVQALTRINALTRGSASDRAELLPLPAFQALTLLLYEQVPSMNNVQLSNSLYALAQLGIQPPEPVIDAYWRAARTRADKFYPRDISTLFAAAAALRASPPQSLLDSLGFRARAFLSTGEFELRGISMLLHSCVLLGYTNRLLGWEAAQQVAAPGAMARMAPQGVANTLWALGRMGVYHPPAVEAALTAFAAQPLSYKPQECANLLWALTAFRHHPESNFALIAKNLLHRLDELRPADLATALYALATFNVDPGKAVLTRLASRVMTMLAQRDSERGAVAIANPTFDTADEAHGSPDVIVTDAAITTGPKPSGSGRSVRATAKAAAKAVETVACRRGTSTGSTGTGVNAVELANLYWGLALLGAEGQLEPCLGGRLMGELERALAEEWEAADGALPKSLMRMAFQGFLATRLSGTARPHAFTSLALDALKRTWTAEVIAGAQGRSTGVNEVADMVQKLRVTHDSRRPTRDGLALIDVAIKAGPERYIALQVVPAEEQCANSRQLLGTQHLDRQLLEKNGWEVRYVASRDLASMEPDTRLLFLAELLRALGLRPRGPALVAASAVAGTAGSGKDGSAKRAGDSPASSSGGGRMRGGKSDADVLMWTTPTEPAKHRSSPSGPHGL